ncbi:MAG: ABC transporter substrate-binding protein, partial [Candidatus Omnitrophica bacterium]|nr:ABC transporter substrate-binding protein [Candidatus Omnitrophota bacterium]
MNFKKIVSLSPSVTEILFLLKSGRKVAGVTEQCRRMEQAKDKESVGSFLHPDVKKIVSLNPDLVITYKKIRDEFLSAELKKRNITVFIFAPVKVEEIFDEMEKIGSAAGSGNLAKSLTGRLRKRIDLVREKVSGRALPRVLRLMRGVPVTIPVTIPSP